MVYAYIWYICMYSIVHELYIYFMLCLIGIHTMCTIGKWMRGSTTMVYIHMCVRMDMAMLFGLRWRGAPHLVLSTQERVRERVCEGGPQWPLLTMGGPLEGCLDCCQTRKREGRGTLWRSSLEEAHDAWTHQEAGPSMGLLYTQEREQEIACGSLEALGGKSPQVTLM